MIHTIILCCEKSFGEIHPDLRVFDLRVIDIDLRPLLTEVSDESDSCRLACVAGIGLERKSQHRNALATSKLSPVQC